jgi:hypothetical protein
MRTAERLESTFQFGDAFTLIEDISFVALPRIQDFCR